MNDTTVLRPFLVSLLLVISMPRALLAGDPPASPPVSETPSSLLRNIGGVGGAVAGGVGGSMLANLLIRSAAVQAQGPLLVKGIQVLIPVVGAVLAARATSLVGTEGDRLIGGKTSGTIIGTAVGALGGFAFLSRLAMFGGPSGKAVAMLLGAVAGGIAGGVASGQVNWASNPAVLGGLTGGFFGFRGGGVLGGLAGLAIGGITGYTMDSLLFARKDDRLRDAIPSMPSLSSMPSIPFLSRSAGSVETARAPQGSLPVDPVTPVTDDPLNAGDQVRYTP